MFRRLTGLPPYGPMATTIPTGWGHGAHEGMVVEFERADGTVWVGNFEPGLGGADDVLTHPNGSDVLVVAAWSPDGDRWSPFVVNLVDGTVAGGSYSGADMTFTYGDLDRQPL